MPTTLRLVTPDGTVAHTLRVPTQWADVTLAQFVALHAAAPDDHRTVAEVLLGLEAGALNQLAADDVPLIAGLLTFASDPSPVLELLPTPGLPDVGGLPYGCLLLCQQQFEANAERPDLASLPYLLAVYRCQLTYGTIDSERVAKLLEQLLAAPVTEVYADGAHFLAACRNWQPGTRQTKPMSSSPKTRKSMRGVRTWLQGLGLPSHWTRSPAATS
ncbi:hypothetical protein [Hymenobacter cheonanensis]|uniref:hypothetical protein n=1 Tax=Hymenobacter sp. CA2-7 TaxID=3063993 RepID=UPI0027143009|nr:hypothetical protein [Hymenobacter sp. CA2-7]MDO7888158.1 hypothetical protein [Hymenobacter sp. CA2-7]